MTKQELDALLARLRKGSCRPESCRNCSLSGNCVQQAATQAADLIEKLLNHEVQIL